MTSGRVNVSAFGARGDGVTDDSAAIQAALDWAASSNTALHFPRGTYVVKTGLTITGNATTKAGHSVTLSGDGIGFDGGDEGSTVKWGGTSDVANTLLTVNGVCRLSLCDIALNGMGSVGTVLQATQGAGTFNPFGWTFERCYFSGVTPGGACFSINTSSGLARFQFSSCFFVSGTGFYSGNQNSLNHQFIGCHFNAGDYGIHLNGGSFTAIGCEFTRNAIADVYLQICSSSSLIQCWSEQSKQFVATDFRNQYSNLSLISCTASSYPWAYWKQDEANRTQPTNDATQWTCVSWDRPAGLCVVGCTFNDPFLFAATGTTAPTTSSQPTVRVPNTHTGGVDVVVTGSSSMNGAGPTYGKGFAYYVNTALN